MQECKSNFVFYTNSIQLSINTTKNIKDETSKLHFNVGLLPPKEKGKSVWQFLGTNECCASVVFGNGATTTNKTQRFDAGWPKCLIAWSKYIVATQTKSCPKDLLFWNRKPLGRLWLAWTVYWCNYGLVAYTTNVCLYGKSFLIVRDRC